MDRFRNLLRSMDRSSNPPNTPVAIGSTSDVPDRSSGGALSSLLSNRQSQSHSQPQPQSHSQSQSQSQQNPAHPRSSNRQWAGVTQYSSYSTQGPFHTRMFVSENFMLGAGAVIIQPSSGKVVIVQEGNYWFLPKGRKDLGESIEQAALREAYEESGYQCEFLPLYHWTNAPVQSRHVCRQKHTEPLHITITSYSGRRSRPPGEYLTFWYVCQIGPDAVRELGTGMPDEAGFVSHLVTYEVAEELLEEVEGVVLSAAFSEWLHSKEADEQLRAQRGAGEEEVLNNDGERA